jgi:hypothetical protein
MGDCILVIHIHQILQKHRKETEKRIGLFPQLFVTQCPGTQLQSVVVGPKDTYFFFCFLKQGLIMLQKLSLNSWAHMVLPFLPSK